MRLRTLQMFLGMLAGAMLSLTLQAAEPAPPEVAKYVYLEPALVVNYGSTGRLRYIRTEVALKVAGSEAATRVSRHRPYIRNNLVLLFSAQESEVVNSSQGRESLRKVALDEVRALMIKLEGTPDVDDLYFSNFVVQ